MAKHQIIYGEQHPTTLVYKSNLALVYANQSAYNLALPLAEKVMNNWLFNFPNHPASHRSQLDLKHLRRKMSMNTEAEGTFNASLTITTTEPDFSRELRRGWGANAHYYNEFPLDIATLAFQMSGVFSGSRSSSDFNMLDSFLCLFDRFTYHIKSKRLANNPELLDHSSEILFDNFGVPLMVFSRL